MTCIFCDIISGEKNGHFIYEDETHVAFLDKYPIDQGHSLVLPREHFERVTDMNPEKVGALFSKTPKIARGILKATQADAFSMAQNNGWAAKQIVPHVHVHIIPRYNHKGTIWTKRNITNDAELNLLASKIRKNIESS
ncbi:MAG: Histidine triad (HIT) protein [Nitrosopumilales archaeon]|jgi:histidine triad (HIT) family protein|nr:MAG: Histidine triad (HIT) protein [Nitrosopumilales archaeon]